MGQTLSEPITSKSSSCCQNSKFKCGSSCMQGWRVNMEDSHTHILSLPEDPSAAFFGVFDGHGGAKIAEYAGKHLHKYISNRAEYKDGNITDAMKQGFLEIDEMMQFEENLQEPSGTTAITIIIKDNQLFCANVGDSRAVACVNGKATPLSKDHKPNHKEEKERIINAGGWVEYNRVNGNLALSRALGDYIFKRNSYKKPEKQIVTAYPEVTVHTIDDDWEFLVLACDGIWDVMSNQDVINFVRQAISKGEEPEEICEKLMMRCLAPDLQMAGLGCDNMTVIIVCLLHEKTYEELSVKCSSKNEHEHSEDESTDDAEDDPKLM